MQSTVSVENRDRFRGVVKFFNSQKGYGFIIPLDVKHVNPNGRNEIFVHHSAIINEGGFKSLAENEQVEYSLAEGPKGIQAADVTGPGGAPVLGDPMINKIFLQNGFNSYMAFGHMGCPIPPGPLPPYYSTSMYPLHSMYGMQQHGMMPSPLGSMTSDGYNAEGHVGNIPNGHNTLNQQSSFRYQSTSNQTSHSTNVVDQAQHTQNRVSSNGSVVSSQSTASRDDNNAAKLAMTSHTFSQSNIASPPSPLRAGSAGHANNVNNSFSGNVVQVPMPPLPISTENT